MPSIYLNNVKYNGVGAKGKNGENVTIAKIEPIVGGNRVTFSWYDDNDTQQSSSIEIMNGKDAVSIASARVENGNELILGLSDGTELDPVTITIDSSNISLDGYYSATEIDTLLENQKTELTEYIDEKVTETVDDKVDTATEEDINNLF